MLIDQMEVNINSDCQDILSELRTFIAGAARPSDINHLSLVRTAVSLLKTVPAAREALLEYFGIVFHNYIAKYLALFEVLHWNISTYFNKFQYSIDVSIESFLPQSGTFTVASLNESDALVEEEMPLIEIQDVLCQFVKRNSEAWAPIVSTWSLELLGMRSSLKSNF